MHDGMDDGYNNLVSKETVLLCGLLPVVIVWC
jgi:hypothetical protein